MGGSSCLKDSPASVCTLCADEGGQAGSAHMARSQYGSQWTHPFLSFTFELGCYMSQKCAAHRISLHSCRVQATKMTVQSGVATSDHSAQFHVCSAVSVMLSEITMIAGRQGFWWPSTCQASCGSSQTKLFKYSLIFCFFHLTLCHKLKERETYCKQPWLDLFMANPVGVTFGRGNSGGPGHG